MSQLQAYTIMFLSGGFTYCGVELIARGRSHISMFFAGGICFILVGFLEYILGSSVSFLSLMVLTGLMITIVEFAFGILVNRGLHLNVWDYSGQQYNFLGQICLFYTNLWILLAAPMILLHDIMRYLLMDIPLTHYRIF